jgi:hypothetical protein
MTPSEAIERMIKLATRRHTDGMPDHLICFDAEGNEVEWAKVMAASPKKKVGELDVYNPTPGTGYFCDIVLKGFETNAKEERVTFEIRSPAFAHKATYVQPHMGVGYFAVAVPNPDEKTAAVLVAIGQKT